VFRLNVVGLKISTHSPPRRPRRLRHWIFFAPPSKVRIWIGVLTI
jgi:hypothetical protein